jgi:hypothetical protein
MHSLVLFGSGVTCSTHAVGRQRKPNQLIAPCPSHLSPENSERGSGLTSLVPLALASLVLMRIGLYFFYRWQVDPVLILRQQVWLSFEGWSVPNPLDLLSQTVLYLPLTFFLQCNARRNSISSWSVKSRRRRACTPIECVLFNKY